MVDVTLKEKPQRVTSVAELLHHSNGADRNGEPSIDNDTEPSGTKSGNEEHLQVVIENHNHDATEKSSMSGFCLNGGEYKPKRKRRRVPVSCNVCRQRKLKCDRQHPCGSCKQLRLTHTCRFESSATYFDDKGQKTALKTPSNLPSLNLGPGDFDNQLVANASGGDGALGNIVDLARASLEDSLRTNGGYYAHAKIEQLYKSMLQHSATNGTNRFVPCSASQCIIDDPLFFDYLRAVKLTSLDTVSKFESPEKTVQLDNGDPFAETLQMVTPGNALEDSSKWNNMLVHFPAYEICEYMREVFLNTYNNVFRGFTAYSLRKDVDDARQIYLRYVLVTRQNNESSYASSGQGFKMSMPEVHTVSLVLLIIHLARLTLPESWTTKDIPGVEDDIYLGDSLRQLALAVVQATDIETENNLRFVQLVMCLTIYQQGLIGECDRFGGYSDPDLVSILIRSAQINGLHRDPNKYDRIEVTESALRRHLWRQVIFLDAVHALEVVRPLQVNLGSSDTSLDTYEGSELQHPWEMSQFMTQWSLITRRTLDMVLLSPHTQVTQFTLDRIEQAILSLEPGANLSEENQLICRLLRLSLQIKFQQAIAVDSTADVTAAAIEVLVVQEVLVRKCNYISSSLAMRLGASAWYIAGASLIYPVADLQRALNESACDNNTPADVVRLIQRSYEWIRENSQRSFFLWRAHLFMNSMLVCLKAASSSSKPELAAAVQFTECIPPKHAKWLDYTIKEMSREGSSLYIRDKKDA